MICDMLIFAGIIVGAWLLCALVEWVDAL